MAARSNPPKPGVDLLYNETVDAWFSDILDIFTWLIDGFVDAALAFPNLKKMADILAARATGLIGRFLVLPIRFRASTIAVLVDRTYGSRLMRPSEAIRMVFRGYEEIVQALTLTDESGIIAIFLSYLARATYRLVKKIKFLRALLRVKSEAEFVELIVKKIKFKGKLLLWAAIFIISTLLLTAVSIGITSGAIGIVLSNGLFPEYVLPQDSKRTWSRKGRVVRQNARRGPDRRTPP